MNVADALRREEYNDGDLIIQQVKYSIRHTCYIYIYIYRPYLLLINSQGDKANEFYLVVEGEVTIRMRNKVEN